MAKKKSLVKYRTRVVKAVRRAGKKRASPFAIALGGYVLGALEQHGMLTKLPTIYGTDVVLNAGIIGWGAEKFGGVKSKLLHDVTTAALAVGAYRMGMASEFGRAKVTGDGGEMSVDG